MKRLLTTTAIVAGASLFGNVPSYAALQSLTDFGVTYTLEMAATANPLIENSALTITGENTGTDTEGGRKAVEAFAFTAPANGVASATVLSPPGYTFVNGGLSNSGGSGDCDMTGNSFCFHNPSVSTASVR